MKPNITLQDQIPYKADLNPEHLTALENQLKLNERSTPMVFGGRTEIIDRIERRLIRAEEATRRDCYTTVVQGAPGTGKTTLIYHLKTLVQTGELATPDGVSVINIKGEDCDGGDRFLAAVLGNMWVPPNKVPSSEPIIKWYGDTFELRTIWILLEKSGLRGTVLLCVDEAQNVKPIRINEILNDLHHTDTRPLKVVPLFLGLPNTSYALSRAGLSRLAETPIQLSALTQSETREIVVNTLNHDSLGLGDSLSQVGQDYLVTSLDFASERWPRHLHYYIQGLLLAILEDQRRESPSHQIDLNRVLDYGHNERILYYQRQLGNLETRIGSDRYLDFVETLEDLSTNRNIPFKQLRDVLREKLGKGKSGEVSDMVAAAIHTGVLTPLQVVGRKKVTQIPIPSLRTFIQCGQDAVETLSRLRENHAKRLARELGGLEH